MKLEHIRYICEVYKTRSINKAAENLYLSQPYLSKCIKNIEQLIGVTLMTRSTKGVVFTEAGEQFIKYALTIEDCIEKLFLLKSEVHSEYITLRLAGFYSFTMIDMVQSAIQQGILSPLTLEYEETQNWTIYEKVKTGQSDFGLLYLDSASFESYMDTFQTEGFTYDLIQKDHLYAVVNRQNPLYSLEAVVIKDLIPYKLVIENYKESQSKNQMESHPVTQFFKRFDLDRLPLNNNASLLYHLTNCADGFTIGQKRFNTTNPLVANGDLKYLPILDSGFDMLTGFVYSKQHPQETAIRTFIEFAKALL